MSDSVLDRMKEILRLVEALQGPATTDLNPCETLAQFEQMLARFEEYRNSNDRTRKISEARDELLKLQTALDASRGQTILGKDAHALLLPLHEKVGELVKDLDRVFGAPARSLH